MNEDVTVETQDQEVETTEVVSEADSQAPVEAEDAQDDGGEVVELTVEEKLQNLERESEAKQKAIDRKTAAYNSLQKALERERQERQELLSKVQEQQPDKAPSPDDFDTHEEYDKARLDYLVNRGLEKKQQEFIQQQEQQRVQRLQQERASLLQMQEKEYLSVNPNYESSKREFGDFLNMMTIPPDVEKAFVHTAYKGNVAQIIDYFGANNGANLDKLTEISKMNPYDAAIEVHKIQQSLKAPQKKETKPAPRSIKTKGKGAPKRGLGPHSSGEDVLKQLGLK